MYVFIIYIYIYGLPGYINVYLSCIYMHIHAYTQLVDRPMPKPQGESLGSWKPYQRRQMVASIFCITAFQSIHAWCPHKFLSYCTYLEVRDLTIDLDVPVINSFFQSTCLSRKSRCLSESAELLKNLNSNVNHCAMYVWYFMWCRYM